MTNLHKRQAAASLSVVVKETEYVEQLHAVRIMVRKFSHIVMLFLR